ncbi:invasion protein CiaB [Campylobacter sp. RM12920]|uniref:Invasion protein CiaB n=1 Tax=Campylobacter californiensis TaxID=1032243 RepID=A0ABD4JGD0_9BACT|nr:invasion protein CiaB [Campylobacter sp. RM12919]MBE2987946.1 invasion protein CiaB [Campylobacter sp. RM12920]
MNNFKRLNEIVAQKKLELNEIYKNLNNKLIDEALEICALKGSGSERMAVARRIIDLKVDPLENELKKLGKSEDEIAKIKIAMFNFVRKIYEKRHKELISQALSEKILDKFYIALTKGMHDIGLALNAWQIIWEDKILNTTNKEFDKRFNSLSQAAEFIDKNRLFQLDENGQKADRTYGAVVQNGENFSFAPYAVVFENEVKNVKNEFEILIQNLKNLSDDSDEHEAYIRYFSKLRDAFCEQQNDKTIKAWQEAEIAWMDVKSPLQPGHPLEYYEDAYTHAVALEWDIRLVDSTAVNEEEFKQKILQTYSKVSKSIGAKNERMHEQVKANVNRTQLYVSVPMIYYGAELNGLFSAQVVPNDESVSAKCGKKIFAFVNHVYESAKAKPFMKLSSEIFSKEFLDFGREILFLKPEIWKKVYEISTIGHEFGHILFIDTDTENIMNKGGVFKFIEEYKATTGGLVNFFYHEDERYKMSVFHELIARAVGLIAWKNVGEVRAYYCEGLVHLNLLFKAKVLEFKDTKLSVDFSEQGYERFKILCLKNYEELATCYANKHEAGEFLAKFCVKHDATYLPKDSEVRKFVEHFYARYEAIGNELDTSGEWEKWQEKVKNLG